MEQTIRYQRKQFRYNSTTCQARLPTAASSLKATKARSERDEFTFIPELNFKMGYRFRDHVELTAGYTFLMFGDVALAGENVDRLVDGTTLNTPSPFPARPGFDFKDSSLWVQGVDLGLAITY